MPHTHCYTRINIGRDKEYWVMKCNLPGCNSYTPGKSKLSFPQLRGEISKCNKCGELFQLDRRSLRMAKPICAECVKSKVRKELKSADEFFDSLLGGVKE